MVYWGNRKRTDKTSKQNNIRIVHFHGPKPFDGVDKAAVCDLDANYNKQQHSKGQYHAHQAYHELVFLVIMNETWSFYSKTT
jgi:hypothetical protein